MHKYPPLWTLICRSIGRSVPVPNRHYVSRDGCLGPITGTASPWRPGDQHYEVRNLRSRPVIRIILTLMKMIWCVGTGHYGLGEVGRTGGAQPMEPIY